MRKTILLEVEKKWCEIENRRYMHVRPNAAISAKQWLDFLKTELKGYQEESFFFLVDVIGIDDQMNYRGFNDVMELLKKLNIRLTRIAVVSHDPYFTKLGEMYSTAAKAKGFDAKVNMFRDRDDARIWLGKQ